MQNLQVKTENKTQRRHINYDKKGGKMGDSSNWTRFFSIFFFFAKEPLNANDRSSEPQPPSPISAHQSGPKSQKQTKKKKKNSQREIESQSQFFGKQTNRLT